MSMDPIALAVIGGTGLYRLAGLQDAEEHQPVTRYGALSGPVRVGRIAGKRVAFLARHGEGHSVPPHLVNYRANLSALHALGAHRVLALNTVGGITAAFGPRVLACPDQLIDYTWGRVSTFCEEPGTEVLHVDMGDPYTPSLRREVLAAGEKLNLVAATGELAEAQANLRCVIDVMIAYGTHSIVIARVLQARVSDHVAPLVYQDGGFL